jgi:hypothetical protein
LQFEHNSRGYLRQCKAVVPWDKAIISNVSINLVLVLSAGSMLCIFLLWPNLYKTTKLGK